MFIGIYCVNPVIKISLLDMFNNTVILGIVNV